MENAQLVNIIEMTELVTVVDARLMSSWGLICFVMRVVHQVTSQIKPTIVTLVVEISVIMDSFLIYQHR